MFTLMAYLSLISGKSSWVAAVRWGGKTDPSFSAPAGERVFFGRSDPLSLQGMGSTS